MRANSTTCYGGETNPNSLQLKIEDDFNCLQCLQDLALGIITEGFSLQYGGCHESML